jgi:hypothetical protein
MAGRYRADASGPFKEFVLTEWLRDGMEDMCHKMKYSKEQFEPVNFRRHIRNAQKEQLLAMRSIIDSALERLEKVDEEVEE